MKLIGKSKLPAEHLSKPGGRQALALLATRIRAEHAATAAAVQSSVDHALAAGDLLAEAKAKVSHGQWLPWLTRHCEMAERTAQLYMRLARNRIAIEAKRDSGVDVTLHNVQALLAAPPPPPPKPARKLGKPARKAAKNEANASTSAANPQRVADLPKSGVAAELLPPSKTKLKPVAAVAAENVIPGHGTRGDGILAARGALEALTNELGGTPDKDTWESEEDALSYFATILIDELRDAGDSPEEIRMTLADYARAILQCRNPQHWHDTLMAWGDGVVAEAGQ
jgi:Protein of unknown function (DUF3102)